MITGKTERTISIFGKSTDTKPTNKYIGNGSIYLELDTSKTYMFDAENKQWIEVSFGGGSEPAAYIKSASVTENKLSLLNKNGTTVDYKPTDYNYDSSAKAKVDAIPADPKYTDTTYTGDNSTIVIDDINKISVKPDVYQDKLTDEQIALFEKDTLYYADEVTTKLLGGNKFSVNITDDAARSQWGGGWRLPTLTELNELWSLYVPDGQTWVFISDASVASGGRPGYVRITNNGNSIILPSTEKRGGNDSDLITYPTRNIRDDNSYFYAKSGYAELWRGTNNRFNLYDGYALRYTEHYIRPVLDKGANANGHTAVDLGLSVLWADRNIGATEPKNLGSKFAIGETEVKETYTFENYRYSDTVNGTSENPKYIKYVTNDTYGEIDNLSTLNIGNFYTIKEVERLFANKLDIIHYESGNGIQVSGNKLNILVDNTTIKFNSSGQLTVIGGGGGSYVSGDAINIDSDNKINVKYDSSTLKINEDGKLAVNSDNLVTQDQLKEATIQVNASDVKVNGTPVATVASSSESANVGDYIFKIIE